MNVKIPVATKAFFEANAITTKAQLDAHGRGRLYDYVKTHAAAHWNKLSTPEATVQRAYQRLLAGYKGYKGTAVAPAAAAAADTRDDGELQMIDGIFYMFRGGNIYEYDELTEKVGAAVITPPVEEWTDSDDGASVSTELAESEDEEEVSPDADPFAELAFVYSTPAVPAPTFPDLEAAEKEDKAASIRAQIAHVNAQRVLLEAQLAAL
jgi:hypothetical protein